MRQEADITCGPQESPVLKLQHRAEMGYGRFDETCSHRIWDSEAQNAPQQGPEMEPAWSPMGGKCLFPSCEGPSEGLRCSALGKIDWPLGLTKRLFLSPRSSFLLLPFNKGAPALFCKLHEEATRFAIWDPHGPTAEGTFTAVCKSGGGGGGVSQRDTGSPFPCTHPLVLQRPSRSILSSVFTGFSLQIMNLTSFSGTLLGVVVSVPHLLQLPMHY